MRHGLETVPQMATGEKHVLADVLVDERLDGGSPGCGRKRVASEGRTVVTWVHEVGNLGACGDGAHGEAVGDALGHAHDVWLDARTLVHERRPAAEEARLDLVDKEQHVALAAELGNGTQVVVVGRPDAALPLDAFEQDSAHGTRRLAGVVDRVAQRLKVVEGHGGKSRGNGLEAFMEPVLAGRRERGERAAVEALPGGDDARGPSQLDLTPAAGDLYGSLVRLRARVAEERAPRGPRGAHHVTVLVTERREELGGVARELVAVLHVEVVAHLPHLVDLRLEGGDDGVVRMAEACGTDAAEAVDVLVACRVDENGTPSGDELHGQTSIGVHEVGLVVLDHARGNGAPNISGHGLSSLVLQKHGADALVGEDLEQQRMRKLAIDDNDLADAGVERVVDGLNLWDHPTIERLRLEELLGLRLGELCDEGVRIVLVAEEAIDVGEVDELVGTYRLGDLAGRDVGVDVVEAIRPAANACDHGDVVVFEDRLDEARVDLADGADASELGIHLLGLEGLAIGAGDAGAL